ncbi:MAG TPA: FliA/WhiG family RNA polymerase sigma factor [Candidatus Hydrogenedentes bacterium]|nr:FliA/WhiG family RNA polymerase sigma factor [Candidatus Hydrogenedentota bacterium]HOL76523.1 FliA/WhiG family RNA polymerase sigma factor [Candidatus Hydrogenedentota bacterium]HPO85187.1 FliA/WhiG family RNA polymerase sigma factor [Candidatus Hydrogenedentota bacterium]
MSTNDEKELWIRWREKGDETARETIILNYMRVVKFIAGRMAIHVPPSIDMGDLISWGVIGLLDAVDKYDYKQDIKFTTYAAIRVRGAILDHIRSLDWAPRSLRALARRIAATRDTLRHRLSREPHPEEIASELGIDVEQIEDAISQLQTTQILALDDYLPGNDDPDKRRLDLTSDPTAQSPEALAADEELQERIVQAILRLPEQQQKVLHLYYYEKLTLKEIGVVLNVTESRICQIHTAAMKTLRKMLRSAT